MKEKMTAEKLRAFSTYVKHLFELGKINTPVHLSGGNEENLITIFATIKEEDYVFSTHRSHYHYLLKGGCEHKLVEELLGTKYGMCKGMGRSMHLYDKSINFYTSAIVGGICPIACGVGLSLKKKKSTAHAYVFVGDGAEDTGSFLEAIRFSLARALPITWIVEDNDLAVGSTKKDRWHNFCPVYSSNVIRYEYRLTHPHVGVGKHVAM